MHPSAITTAQKMRAADIAADAAMQDASSASLGVALALELLGAQYQMHDADAILLIHALLCAIQRSGHGHIDRWGNLADELTGWVLCFDEAVRADKAEVRRAA